MKTLTLSVTEVLESLLVTESVLQVENLKEVSLGTKGYGAEDFYVHQPFHS
jgi:hypothetical protein